MNVQKVVLNGLEPFLLAVCPDCDESCQDFRECRVDWRPRVGFEALHFDGSVAHVHKDVPVRDHQGYQQDQKRAKSADGDCLCELSWGVMGLELELKLELQFESIASQGTAR